MLTFLLILNGGLSYAESRWRDKELVAMIQPLFVALFGQYMLNYVFPKHEVTHFDHSQFYS